MTSKTAGRVKPPRTTDTTAGRSAVFAVIERAQDMGLMTADTQQVGARLPMKLLEQAKKRTGIDSTTDLLAFALANVAIEDGFAAAFVAARGMLDPDLDIGFWLSLLSRHAEKLCSRLDLTRLTPRARGDLAFVDSPMAAGSPLLLDTGLYIHQLKSKTPQTLDALVNTRIVNHSIVAVQEILHAIGVLDPADPRTKANVAAIRGLLDEIPSHRLFAPTRDVMCDAAVYAGALCRMQTYTKDRRLRALHDCTLFFQARKLGLTLVSANVVDFDLLQQMQPEGRVLFYETV